MPKWTLDIYSAVRYGLRLAHDDADDDADADFAASDACSTVHKRSIRRASEFCANYSPRIIREAVNATVLCPSSCLCLLLAEEGDSMNLPLAQIEACQEF